MLEALPIDDRRIVWEQSSPSRRGWCSSKSPRPCANRSSKSHPAKISVALLVTLDPEDLGYVSESLPADVLDEASRALDIGDRSVFEDSILYEDDASATT